MQIRKSVKLSGNFRYEAASVELRSWKFQIFHYGRPNIVNLPARDNVNTGILFVGYMDPFDNSSFESVLFTKLEF